MKNNNSFQIIIFLLILVVAIGLFAFLFKSFDMLNTIMDEDFFDSNLSESNSPDNDNVSGSENDNSSNNGNNSQNNSSNGGNTDVYYACILNLYTIDFNYDSFKYGVPVRHDTLIYTGKENTKQEVNLEVICIKADDEDDFDRYYYPKVDLRQNIVFEGNYESSVNYYESQCELCLSSYNSSTKTAVLNFDFNFAQGYECIVVKSNLDYDVENIVFSYVRAEQFITYTLENYLVPSGGYLVLFPNSHKILGFEKNGESYNDYMTCSYNDVFEYYLSFSSTIQS